MAINWFPGHMMKSMRMMDENIKLVDCVLYVLDARIPSSCINPYFEEMMGMKPVIYLFNKADLADPVQTEQWLHVLTDERHSAIALTATTNRAVKDILRKVVELNLKKVELRKAKGISYTPRAMVVGVPNTGKSTVINTICGKAKAITGDKAGVTRGKQWVRVESIDLLDTPGTLPKKINDEIAGYHLAMVGSVKEEVVDIADLAFHLIEELKTNCSGILAARYNIDESGETLAVMDRIAASRGFLMRGGEYDYDRTASSVLDDFRKGRMGQITLERAKDFKC